MKSKSQKQPVEYGDIQVKMTIPKGKKPTRNYAYSINGVAALGKEIKISPKSHVTVNNPGYKTEFFVETVTLLIGIGKDHTADLVMTREAWDALNKGAKVDITTLKTFKKDFIHSGGCN